MIIFTIFPILSFLLLAACFHNRALNPRKSLISAAVTWGVILAIITEILSILSLLNLTGLSVAWALAVILTALIYYSLEKQNPDQVQLTLTKSNILALCSIVVVYIITAFTAVVAPPNSFDSMTYHMSRVVHWIQNQNVAHYPTSILRQIELNPWAEFAITNFQIFSGGDHLANFIQWFCMVGSIIGVTLIAETLGADHRGQILAAVIAATIPMGILQSSSTQNDCVVAFWLVCLVYFGMLFSKKPCWVHALAMGASLGLSILTKGTAYLYAFPLLIWFAIIATKTIKLKFIKYLVFIMLVALSLNLGHYIRNYEIFGNILGSGEIQYSNEIHSITSMVSNLSRNTAIEAGSSLHYANHVVKSGVESLHTFIGFDINDSRTTWPSTEFDVGGRKHEDSVGNPLHLLLIIISISAISCIKKFRHQTHVFPYSIALVIAFSLFCFYLKWQPWHNRLLLPLIILWSPIIALVVVEVKQFMATDIIQFCLIITTLPFLLFNESRPLVTEDMNNSILFRDRNRQYFINNPGLEPYYYGIVNSLKSINCSNVAISKVGAADMYEYPLWILLQQEFKQIIRIEHVNVGNSSGRISLSNFDSCQTVFIDR